MSGRHNVLGEVQWIPALELDGETCTYVSPLELLREPARWATIQFSHPMHTAATWRWLLALAVAAAEQGGLEAYAERWWDAFYLLDSEQPFGQRLELTETLEKNAIPAGLVRLDSRRAKGNNAVLWDHTMADTPLHATPAQVVPLLVWTMAAAVGGNITPTVYQGETGKKIGSALAPIKDRVVAMAYGPTLADSLACAMAQIERVPGDRPLWERPDEPFTISVDERKPSGPLDWLTWNSRNNLLDWSGDTVVGAVSTPAWGPPKDLDRLALDPTLIPVLNKPKMVATPKEGEDAKPLHASQARKWVHTVRSGDPSIPRPAQFAGIEGPINVAVLWQGTDNAKYTGTWREVVHFPASEPEQEQPHGQ